VQAYGATHPEPALTPYLARTFDPEALRASLADPAQAVLVAAAPGRQPIGYAYVRPTAGEPPPGVPGARPFELLRFYVDGAWLGRGVAAALLAAAEAAAAAQGADALWLDVWQEAARPISFYRRAGFEVVGTAAFEWGERRDADFVMARVLPGGPAGSAA
jgi:ribosomal protein S18 acetylase RimI-like enzyme